jgi:hypothetical protein
MRKYLQISLLIFYHIAVKAQFSDSITYYTNFTSTGTYNRTDASRYYLFNNGFKFSAKKKSISFNSTNKWLYGQQDNKLTNNDVSSVQDFNLYKTLPHFYYWGLLNYTSSYSLKINSQFQAGLGVAYNVIDKKNLVLNVSDGVVYDYSNIILVDGMRDLYGTPRNSLRLQVKWNIKDRLVFSGNGFLQNSLQHIGDYIIKSDVSLSVKLKKWLSITSAYSFNKITRTGAENVLLTFGVTIENYF